MVQWTEKALTLIKGTGSRDSLKKLDNSRKNFVPFLPFYKWSNFYRSHPFIERKKNPQICAYVLAIFGCLRNLNFIIACRRFFRNNLLNYGKLSES
jgi:hypothetical protein